MVQPTEPPVRRPEWAAERSVGVSQAGEFFRMVCPATV